MSDPTPADTTPSVLVVEDDADLADLLLLHLGAAGYAVEHVADGALALQRALGGSYDAVVLDVMLPGMTGTEVCRELRAAGRTVPVMMLTGLGAEADRVAGLDGGADDYVVKPFSIREVLARVAALLRRVAMERPPPDAAETLAIGDLQIRPFDRAVTRRGAHVDLTVKEFELLVLLARHPGRTFSRQELLDQVWGIRYAGYGHTVNTHINRLRAKVEPDPASPTVVQTVWGVGYRLGDGAAPSSDA